MLAKEERPSFLKKRSKKLFLLRPHHLARACSPCRGIKRIKVFWFLFSKITCFLTWGRFQPAHPPHLLPRKDPQTKGAILTLTLLLPLTALWLATAMAGAWALQRLTRNCGWVDAVWSGATGLIGAGAALVPAPGAAVGPRHLLAAAMVFVWGARLAWHIVRRTPGHAEDPRYAEFRREWGAAFEQRLFTFLMIQAAAAWVLVAAVVLAARNPSAFPRPPDLNGLAVFALAVYGEAVADRQMERFRAGRSGGVCDDGLWGWSRHPNYFFEFLGWCAYPLLALNGFTAYPQGFLAVAAPALMFLLLRYVSGVPPLEKSMLARRGDAFRAYQERVSAFFPLPPKRISK